MVTVRMRRFFLGLTRLTSDASATSSEARMSTVHGEA